MTPPWIRHRTDLNILLRDIIFIIEPVSSIRYQLTSAHSEDSNQSAHIHSLIRVIVFCLKKHWTFDYPIKRSLKALARLC